MGKEIELTDRFVYMCLADNTADGVVSSNSTILIRLSVNTLHCGHFWESAPKCSFCALSFSFTRDVGATRSWMMNPTKTTRNSNPNESIDFYCLINLLFLFDQETRSELQG